jgi:steroid delta-isomerase-like uncharacterized protein
MGVGKDLFSQFDTLYGKRDYTRLASLFVSDAVYTDPFGRYEGGGEAITAYIEQADRPFSDIRMEISLLIEEGDKVVAEWTWTATQTGPLPMPDGSEIPATGKTVVNPGMTVFTVRDGKFASEREYFDGAAMMSQLGLMPGS